MKKIIFLHLFFIVTAILSIFCQNTKDTQKPKEPGKLRKYFIRGLEEK